MILDRNPYIYFDTNNTDARWLFWGEDQYYKGENITCSKIVLWAEGDKVIGPDEVSYWDDTDRNT